MTNNELNELLANLAAYGKVTTCRICNTVTICVFAKHKAVIKGFKPQVYAGLGYSHHRMTIELSTNSLNEFVDASHL